MSNPAKFPALEAIMIDKIYGNTGCWKDFNARYRAWERVQQFISNQKNGDELLSSDNFVDPPDYEDYPTLGCE